MLISIQNVGGPDQGLERWCILSRRAPGLLFILRPLGRVNQVGGGDPQAFRTLDLSILSIWYTE